MNLLSEENKPVLGIRLTGRIISEDLQSVRFELDDKSLVEIEPGNILQRLATNKDGNINQICIEPTAKIVISRSVDKPENVTVGRSKSAADDCHDRCGNCECDCVGGVTNKIVSKRSFAKLMPH